MQFVILAGGLGTRLGGLTKSVPKPMVPVAGRPFLEHQVALLKKNGATEFVFCVGYRGEMIEEHFGNGRAFGTRIHYAYDGPKLLGPAGALKRAAPLLEGRFLLTYGDAYLRMDYSALMDRLKRSKAMGVMAVYRNDNARGRSDLLVEGGRVTHYDKTGSTPGMVWINFGVTALRKKALDLIPPSRPCGEEEFYGSLISRRQLLAFPVRYRFYEVGTPAALKEFRAYVERRARASRKRS